MTALYGLLLNILWIVSLIKNIKLTNQIEDLNNQKKQLEDRCHQLEREARDEANKHLILESILRNRNQDGERKIY